MRIGRNQRSPIALAPRELEEAAVEAARQGDLRAWEHVIRYHQELVFRSAYLATRDPDLADEATRGAFVRAYRALPDLKPGRALRPWFMGIVSVVARTRLRELAQRQDAGLPDPDPSPRYAATPVPIDSAIPRPTPLEHEAMLLAFGSLIDEDRLLIVSRYSFGLSRSEMAARLGISPDAVEGRLDAAITRLRARLADLGAMAADDAHMRAAPLPAAHFAVVPDDHLGTIVAAVVLSELRWTPDVAPLVCSRLATDALAYPEQFAAEQRARSAAAAATSRSKESAARNGVAPRAATARPVGGVSMAFAALVVFVALVGVTVVAGPEGRDLRTEVGARVGAVLEQAGLQDLAQGITGAPSDQAPPAPGTAVGRAVAAPESAVVPPIATVGAPVSVDERPVLSVVGGRPFKGGGIGARVVVDWAPSAELGRVARLTLERRIDSGPWETVDSADAEETLGSVLHPGRRYSFRVSSVHEDGTVATSPSVGATLTVRDSKSERLRTSKGRWLTWARNAVGGSVLASTTPGARIHTSFTGNKVALVVPVGPASGALRTRIDGGRWSRRDLGQPARSNRRVVLIRDLATGRHSMEIRVDKGVVAVDAVLIVRTYGQPRTG